MSYLLGYLLTLPLFWPTLICIFEDEIAGRAGATADKWLSRNAAKIRMTGNSFGIFRFTASLLALNFLVVGKVHGPVLSHNLVGAGTKLGELAVNSSSFLANAHLYFRRRNRWSCWCHCQQMAQQEYRQNKNDRQQLW